MKISQNIQAQLDSSRKLPSSSVMASSSFESVIENQGKKQKEQEFEKLMKNLTDQGERILHSRSFQDVAKYKRMVKEMMEKAVHSGLGVKDSRHWSNGGSSQNLRIVEELDSELIRLTEAVIEQETKSLDILKCIGEIKGLLINLYT